MFSAANNTFKLDYFESFDQIIQDAWNERQEYESVFVSDICEHLSIIRGEVGGNIHIEYYSGILLYNRLTQLKSPLADNYVPNDIQKPSIEKIPTKIEFVADTKLKNKTLLLTDPADYRKILQLVATFNYNIVSHHPLIFCMSLISLNDESCKRIGAQYGIFKEYCTEIDFNAFYIRQILPVIKHWGLVTEEEAQDLTFDNAISPDFQRTKVATKWGDGGMARTAAETHFLYFTVFSALSKGLTESDFHKTWIRKRAEAWTAVAGVAVRDDTYIDLDFAKSLRETANRVVPLKKLFFLALYNSSSDNPYKHHALTLLKGSNMANVQILSRFITTPIKTEAHFYKPVLKEIGVFMDRLDAIKKNFGEELFPYYKLIYPTASDFSDSSLPHLAYCAKQHIKMSPGQMNKYIIRPTHAPESASILDTLLRKEVQIKSTVLLAERAEFENIVKRMGLDVQDCFKYFQDILAQSPEY